MAAARNRSNLTLEKWILHISNERQKRKLTNMLSEAGYKVRWSTDRLYLKW